VLTVIADVLDEFAATKIDTKAPAPAPSGPGRPTPPPTKSTVEDDDFAKQLQAGMADLLGELEASPDLQTQFKEMVKGIGDMDGLVSGAEASGDQPSAEKPSTKATEESFQETIRRTMERMQESGDQASAAAASVESDDIFAQMLKEMEKGGFDGEASDEDFSKMLMGMMEQLTNKDILYEPMKELYEKFPGWLEKNKDKVDKADLVRYEEHHTLVTEIIGRFERKGYSDSNASDREYIVERMQKVRAVMKQ
jgi:peroxin-19